MIAFATRRLPIAKHAAPGIITITPANPPSPKQPRFPETRGLTRHNSIVIAESCQPELPPGRYHYSLFDGIDTFTIDDRESRPAMQEQIDTLEKAAKQNSREYDSMEEQNGNAVELVSTLIHELECLASAERVNKADIKRLQQIISDSSFET